jgi:hypothetical protein
MPFKLTMDNVDDRPRLSNTGTDALPPALLVWNGLKYPVPALSANATWLPSGQPEPWGSSEVERIFRQRAMRDVSAILFEIPQIRQHNNGTVHNYLMVRP